MKMYIPFTGISFVPTGGENSICGKKETMYISVWFTNYLRKPTQLVQMFGKPTKSLIYAHILFFGAFLYSMFIKNGIYNED